MKNKLAIFDLDGTLFDTREVNYQSYREALFIHGIPLNYDYFCKFCNGLKYSVFLPKILAENRVESNSGLIRAIHDEKINVFPKYLNRARPNLELFEILKDIKCNHYIALATTATRVNCLRLLNHFDYSPYFDLILTQEDVKHPKPSPEQFIKAMDYFEVPKQNTIIFEDSEVGLCAAKESGANYVQIYGYN